MAAQAGAKMGHLILANADDLLGWSGEGRGELAASMAEIGQALDDARWGVSPLYGLWLEKMGVSPPAAQAGAKMDVLT